MYLARVETNIDFKRQGTMYLEDLFQEQRVSGASRTTPGNNLLLREFQR